jgi:hypothetical protein
MPNSPITIPYVGPTSSLYNDAPPIARAVFDAAKNVYCPIYRDFPGFATGSDFGNPFATSTDGFLNDLCAPSGQLPAPPTTPPPGGQCDNVLYNVGYTITGTVVPPSINGTATLTGPIGGIVHESITNNQGQPAMNIYISAKNTATGGRLLSTITGNAASTARANITSITRQDSQPDNCGSLPTGYPSIRPPDAALNVSVPIQVSPNFNVIAPVTVFAPFTQLFPSLKIGDFNIDFDLGGLTISPDVGINLPGRNPVGNPPQQPPAGQKPSDRTDKCNLEEVLKYLKRIRECQECDRDYDFLQTGFVTGKSGQVTVPTGGIPLTVGLELVQKPSNSKEQPGLTEPDVVYGGWGWFSGNGFMAERQRLDADMKLFHAQEKPSPQKFHFTCQAGYEARVTMAYKRLKSPLPQV